MQEPSTIGGRPRLHTDEQILDAALGAFANAGFEAMSLRSLNRELGVSHATVNQRFGSKENLFYAAINHGFGGLVEEVQGELAKRPDPDDDRSYVKEGLRAFLLATSRRPELFRLLNTLGSSDSEKLDHIFSEFVHPTIEAAGDAARRLAEQGKMRPISYRTLYFLVAHGGSAPFTLRALSAKFDDFDGPMNPEDSAETLTDLILAGLESQPEGEN